MNAPRRRACRRGIALLLAVGLVGCDMPRDPEGTLDRVRGGTLRVGISHNPPWTEVTDGQAAGLETELLQELATALGTEIEWIEDSEGDLLKALRRGELDVVACGLVESTPWSKQVGLTQPYLTRAGQAHVLAVRSGENAWLLQLDRFLQSRRAEIRQKAEAEAGE